MPIRCRILAACLVSVWIIASGCASHVLFANTDRNANADLDVDGPRIFFDRHGNQYPTGVKIDLETLRKGESESRASDLKVYFENLRCHQLPATRQSECRRQWAELKAEIQTLEPQIDAYSAGESTAFEPIWEGVQNRLRMQTAHRIAELAQKRRRGTVFVIHGYNNTYAESRTWYDLVKAEVWQLSSEAKEPMPVFVRIHWDGLSQGVPVTIWNDAQRNAPLVGLALRNLLVSLDGLLEVAVSREQRKPTILLTHSTGALVAVNAIGNGLGKFTDDDGSSIYDCHTDDYISRKVCDNIRMAPLPELEHYRLGLLIPAASQHTLAGLNRAAAGPELIVIGANHKDNATRKYGLRPCSGSGSTCLNVRSRTTCKDLGALQSASSSITTAFYEFSNSRVGDPGKSLLFLEEHGMTFQVKRDKWKPFLRKVLFADSSEDDSALCR
jgi:hypothetical protein